jgi:CheY-like chemotaxis protein
MEVTDLVLVAEDNPDDALLLRRAIDRAGIRARIKIVRDGEEMLLYLQGLGAYADRSANPLPALMILDIKMPKKTGLEVLEWLAVNPQFSVVPTVVLSSSNVERDIRQAYNSGANTYFVKPSTFEELVETMRMIQQYWQKAQTLRPIARDGKDHKAFDDGYGNDRASLKSSEIN